MIVFPSIVKQLNGDYFIQKKQAGDLLKTETITSMNQLKIGFKIPFEQAGMDSIISQ